MNLELNNQIVLVTGSSSGIGRGIAEGFLKENARVIITGRDRKTLEKTVSDFSNQYGKNNILDFNGDIQLPDTLKSLYKFIIDNIGYLDHLVCNIGSGKSVPPLSENILEFQRMLEVNLLNAVSVVNQVSSLLEKGVSKENCFPSISFIGSICGVKSTWVPCCLCISKICLN